tara:strand:- start:17730 stop:18938 length:1209 start_codon:yes stop_codon:yes gene_type:complete
MKIEIFFFFFLISISCSQKNSTTPLFENPQEIKVHISELKFGINLDSFRYETHKIKWGQNFSDILSRRGLSNKKIYDASLAIKPFFNLKKLKNGNFFTLFYKHNNPKPSFFVYETSVYDYLICSLDESVEASIIKRKITYSEKKIQGKINSSLYLSFDDLNYPIELVNKMVDIFAWQIDFFRINPGDNYEILYTEELIDSVVVGISNVKAARFTHNDKDFYAFSYNQGLGNDYFDENGKSLRKTFLRSPLNFYRISSRYRKKRFHPVLKRYRDHLGTDYAAPRGTPIMTVADGKVSEARYGRNNGYFVKIKHNNIYSTQYLHMSKFAKGIQPGKNVRQGDIIGYVGSTGLATGPHVCYRFWRNGRQVDPYKQNDLPDGEPILAQHLTAYNYVKEKYLKILDG